MYIFDSPEASVLHSQNKIISFQYMSSFSANILLIFCKINRSYNS